MSAKWRPETLAAELAAERERVAEMGQRAAQARTGQPAPEPSPDAPELVRCPGTETRPCGRRVPLDQMVRASTYPPGLRPRDGDWLCSVCRSVMVRRGLMTAEAQAHAHGAPADVLVRAKDRDAAQAARRERVAKRRGSR